MADKLLNTFETVLAVPAFEVLGDPHAILPTGLIKYDALTAAALNHYAVITASSHPNAGGGGNITCALLSNDFTLGLTDSDEDDETTLCEAGNVVDLTTPNFDADLTGFRDEDPVAAGVFNLWRDLTFGPDAPYLIVHRIGHKSTDLFAIGQEIDIYYAFTDNPVPVHGDGAKQKIKQTFIPKNVAKVSYVITA